MLTTLHSTVIVSIGIGKIIYLLNINNSNEDDYNYYYYYKIEVVVVIVFIIFLDDQIKEKRREKNLK